MNHINYKSLTPIKVNISAEKVLPAIHQNYNTKFSILPYTVPMEYTIVNFIMDKLNKFKRIYFEDLIEEVCKIFCVEAINGALLDTLLTKKGAELNKGYLIITKS
ncbi:MAG: hypothetical protein V4677_13095 [Bacteroidota bacterium]